MHYFNLHASSEIEMIQLTKIRNFWGAGCTANKVKGGESKHWPCLGISAGSLIVGLHCSCCLSFQKLICLCRSGEERIRIDKYPKKIDLKEMKLSVYISGAHSESSKIEKYF